MSAESDPQPDGAPTDEAVVRALLAAFDSGDLPAARALLAEDFAVTSHQTGQTLGADAYVAAHEDLTQSFPNLQRTVTEIAIVRPGVVRVVMTLTATNDRPVRIPRIDVDLPHPTGRTVTTRPHVDHFEIRDHRVVTYRSEQPPGSGLRGLLDLIQEKDGS